jgi:hypothetical protein
MTVIVKIFVTTVTAVMNLALILGCAGCGDGGKTLGPLKEREPFPALTSPENLLQNLKSCHELRDYEHYQPMVRDDFTFVFILDDSTSLPGTIPEFWAAGQELLAARNMFDSEYIPDDPRYKIDKMEMTVTLAGTLRESNLQGGPEGALEGDVFLEIMVWTQDAGELLARSRPLFYFAPDSPEDPVIWRLWKCVDGPRNEGFSASAEDLPQRLTKGAEKTTVIERITWGALKVIYLPS